VFFFNNTSPETANRLPSFRIKNCSLCCVNVPNFSYPNLIKVITFSESMSSENIKNVLMLCLNVHRIIFNISSINEEVLDVNFNYDPIWFKLSQLSSLGLKFPSYNRIVGDRIKYCSVFEVIVRACRYFPRLENFGLSYPMYTAEWMAMFRFLVRHSQTLKSVNIDCKSCLDINAMNLSLISEITKDFYSDESVSQLMNFSFTCDLNNCDAGFAHT